MLFNKDFIFVHYPKTAGKSLTRFFIQAWKGEIYGFLSKGQFKEVEDLISIKGNLHLALGNAHMGMNKCIEEYSKKFPDSDGPKKVFVCMRNPYDLAVSTYFFQRQTYSNNPDKLNFKLASFLTLDEYWSIITTADPSKWYESKYVTKNQIHTISFENLSDDLSGIVKQYNLNETKIDHINRSKRDDYDSYYNDELRKNVSKTFHYFFDHGYYNK